MALIVETGAGVAGAEAYISATDADAWIVLRYGAADTFAAAVSADQERWLRLGTAYVETTYAGRWKGSRVEQDQALSWPRAYVYVEGYLIAADAIPAAIIEATIEAARRYADGVILDADLPRDGAIKREKVDVIEVEYFEGAPGGTMIPAIDNRLAPYLTGGGNIDVIQRG